MNFFKNLFKTKEEKYDDKVKDILYDNNLCDDVINIILDYKTEIENVEIRRQIINYDENLGVSCSGYGNCYYRLDSGFVKYLIKEKELHNNEIILSDFKKYYKKSMMKPHNKQMYHYDRWRALQNAFVGVATFNNYHIYVRIENEKIEVEERRINYQEMVWTFDGQYVLTASVKHKESFKRTLHIIKESGLYLRMWQYGYEETFTDSMVNILHYNYRLLLKQTDHNLW